jgi:putative ABC transport system ATP-binding protein
MYDGKPIMIAEDLTRSFGYGETKTTPLRGVSLTLFPHEMVLIMGPSGSGKSTLLAALSGLLRPDEGRVVARGQDIWRLSAKGRERFRLDYCGFVFQGFNLLAPLSARRQVEIVLRWGEGVSARQAHRRASQALADVDLSNKEHLRPAQLSGGEKQRVAIARALVKEPAIIFADEPTSSLDWTQGRRIVELLQDAAHRRGALVVMVSHDARIVPFCDRVVHLEDGVLVENFNNVEISEGSVV